MGVQERYAHVKKQVSDACIQVGRNPDDVVIVGVSKTVGPEVAVEAYNGGLVNFGENRPDMLLEKYEALPKAQWHFIGNIQSRRIRDIVGKAALIHSVCQISHIDKINDCAKSLGIVQDILLEVNVSGEESKSGFSPDELPAIVHHCQSLSNVRLCGLMTMAPRGDSNLAKSTFKGLYELREQLRELMPPAQKEFFNELSMGMSEDWCEAVAQGATIVRIGRAIFSDQFN